MAIECMVWVLDQSENLTTNEKFVLLGIANHARPNGKNSFPSLDTLGRYTLLSRSTVKRCIANLEEKGFIKKETGGGRKSNLYTLCIERDHAEIVELKLVEGHSDQGQSEPPEGSEETPQQGQALDLVEVQALTPEPLYNRNETEIKPLKKKDEVWDAIMEACGVNAKTLNSNERGRYNKAVKLLKESGATSDEIFMRVRVYRRKFSGAAVTPIAVANHWSELDPATVAIEEVTKTPKGWDAIRQAREERDNGSNKN